MLISRLALSGGTLQVPAWKSTIDSHELYKLSCVLPSVLGLIVFSKRGTLYNTSGLFPWDLMTAGLLIQGLFSYMGDVTTWGYSSLWKRLDVYLAILNTTLYGLFALFPLLGLSQWPKCVSVIQTLSLIWALHYKSKGLNALHQRNMNTFIFCHTCWHSVIWLGATINILLIDYM